MSTYDDTYLLNTDRVEMDIGAGKCNIRLDGKRVASEKYVSGDMEDKLTATIRCYKALLAQMLKGPAEPISLGDEIDVLLKVEADDAE